MKLYEKLQTLYGQMNEAVLEREELTKNMILSICAKEHQMLLGKPGIGKSYVAGIFAKAFSYVGSDGSKAYFQIQLHNGTEVSNLFGPINIEDFKKGIQTNKYQNYLPMARIALFDEITRANKMAKNASLMSINERKFIQDGVALDVKLEMAIATTNFKFNSTEFEALGDRFVSWFDLKGLSRDGRKKLIMGDINKDAVTVRFTEAEMKEIQLAVKNVVLTEETADCIADIRDELKFTHGIDAVSDRKEEKMSKLVRAEAYYNGRTETITEDCHVLVPCFWVDPIHKGKVQDVIEQYSASQKFMIERIELQLLVSVDAYKKDENEIGNSKATMDSLHEILESMTVEFKNVALHDSVVLKLDKHRVKLAKTITAKTKSGLHN